MIDENQAIDRKAAAKINPLVSESDNKETMLLVASYIDTLGALLSKADSDGYPPDLCHCHLLLSQAAAALSYEALLDTEA